MGRQDDVSTVFALLRFAAWLCYKYCTIYFLLRAINGCTTTCQAVSNMSRFNRAYVSESRKTPASDLCPFEDFNFSKARLIQDLQMIGVCYVSCVFREAALKFSNLTKDQADFSCLGSSSTSPVHHSWPQVFTMLRALVQRIGESVADGRRATHLVSFIFCCLSCSTDLLSKCCMRELDLAFGDVGRHLPDFHVKA